MTHVFLRSLDILRERELQAHYEAAKPDLIIKPKLEGISLLDYRKHEDAVAAGVEAAEKIMPALLKLIEEKEKAPTPLQEEQTAVENQKKE